MSKIKIRKMSKLKNPYLRKTFFESRKWILFFEPSLIQTKVSEDLWGLGGAFNKNKTFELQ